MNPLTALASTLAATERAPRVTGALAQLLRSPSWPAAARTLFGSVNRHAHAGSNTTNALPRAALQAPAVSALVPATAQLEVRQARLGELQARHESPHDSLASLPKRSSFSACLNQSLRGDHATPALAVLFVGLHPFMPINDRHSHHGGDELLKIVAGRLRRAMRQQNMVCRLGGDEFACILTGPGGREQLSQTAAQLFDAVSAPLELGGQRLSVRPSIGIALCPTDGTTAATLFKHADSAMVRAKRNQLGFAFFDRSADL